MHQHPKKYLAGSVIACSLVALAILVMGISEAAQPYQPPGSNLIYGDVTHGQRVLSAATNPAAAAAEIHRSDDKARTGTLFSVGAGLEYGNVDDLFDVIDSVSAYMTPTEPGPDEPELPPAPGQLPTDKPTFGMVIDHIKNIDDPDFQDTMDKVVDQTIFLGTTLALLAVEGYGKLHVGGDIPVVIGKEFLGGAWTFNLNVTGTSKAFGVVESIEFNADVALAELEAAYNLTPDDPPTRFDLTGGVELTIDPATGDVSLYFNNDTLLLTRSAIVSEFAIGYSRQAANWGDGKLYWGTTARYFLTRLSRLSTRFGDITDSDELFDSIRHADYRNDNEFGVDFGLLWVDRNYSLGATLTNINEPAFRFPEVDTSIYRSDKIIDFLEQDTEWVMTRQLKLEGSLFTADRRWTLNAAFDTDAVRDPMRDHYQWATVSAGYATGSWWIPGVRVGYRKNLEGSKLGYLGAGVTLFKVLNLDVASTTDSVRISGTELPRGLIVNLGVEISF